MTIVRQSNFELLRIICMIMIIAGHIILHHNTSYSVSNSDEIIKLFGMSFFSVAVNTFVLISGFFGIKFKTERLIRLILQTFFYSTVLMILSTAIGWHSFTIQKDIFAFFPILTKQYWFITCYIVLYVISPWLNTFVNALNKTEYKKLLCVGFFIVYLWPTISYLFNTAQFIGDAGYGIINFMYLYFLGQYIRLHFKDGHSSSFYLTGYLLFALTLFISQYLLSYILHFEFTSWISYNTIFILGGSICLFMAFKNLSFSSPAINYWAKPCLAVYLIHLNPYIWGNFCKHIGLSNFHGIEYIIIILFLPLVIYLVCSLIEICRLKVLNRFENYIASIVKNTYNGISLNL